MYPAQNATLLQRYFTGLTEQTFQCSLGVVDPPLTDYLSGLLVRFVHSEKVYRIRNVEGRRLHEVAEMLVESQERVASAKREVLRHIGDFTLFWAGLYPEALKRMQGREKQDQFLDYCQQGKRSYYMASTIPVDDADENHVLERLSAEFELCVYGLGEVRREWERRDEEAGAGGFLIE